MNKTGVLSPAQRHQAHPKLSASTPNPENQPLRLVVSQRHRQCLPLTKQHHYGPGTSQIQSTAPLCSVNSSARLYSGAGSPVTGGSLATHANPIDLQQENFPFCVGFPARRQSVLHSEVSGASWSGEVVRTRFNAASNPPLHAFDRREHQRRRRGFVGLEKAEIGGGVSSTGDQDAGNWILERSGF